MGGKLIENALPIKNRYAKKIAEKYIKEIKESLNINCCVLGSAGKKPDDEYTGDIDIAIEFEYTSENKKIFYNFFNNKFIVDSPGFKMISIGELYSFEKYNEYLKKIELCYQTVQIDFMFTTDIEYTKFMYHSPDYLNNESKFKGLYRTNLLTYIAGRTPLNDKKYSNVYINDENNKSILTDYWKYTLTYDNGLVITHKTYRGKKGLCKNPVTVKEDTIFVTKNIKEILKIILGEQATIKDCNSYESLIQYIYSNKYIYKNNPDIKYNILNDFFKDPRHDDKFFELFEYIYNIEDSSIKDILTSELILSIA